MALRVMVGGENTKGDPGEAHAAVVIAVFSVSKLASTIDAIATGSGAPPASLTERAPPAGVVTKASPDGLGKVSESGAMHGTAMG